MKKLSLKNLNLKATEMLQRTQLKTVFGGYGGAGNGTECICVNTATSEIVDSHTFNTPEYCKSFCGAYCPSGTAYGCR